MGRAGVVPGAEQGGDGPGGEVPRTPGASGLDSLQHEREEEER